MKNTFIILLILAIIGLIVWDIFFRKDPPQETVVNYEYVTDTVYVDIPYEVIKYKKILTPPQTIKIYEIDSTAIKDLEWMIFDQELLIEGYKQTIALHENYIKQYPTNPKLIAMVLGRDSLSLALLQITGQVVERSWPLDLNWFKYNWNYNSNLTRHPTKPPPIEDSFIQFFVGGGVDITNLSPMVSARGEMSFNKVRLFTDSHINMRTPETSIFRLGLEYKLYGKNRTRDR